MAWELELEANKDQIIETLLNYKIEIVKIKATIGPTVTLYEIVPAVIISTLAIIGTSLVTKQDAETENIYDLAIQDIKETI